MINDPVVEAIAKIARHCARGSHWRKGPKHPVHVKSPLTVALLEQHVLGSPGIGLGPIGPGESTTRIALLDLDSHKGEATWARMVDAASTLMQAMRTRGLAPIPWRSSGGRGIHLICLWAEPQDARSVRALLSDVLAAHGYTNGTKGVVAGEVEIFPKQDSVPADGWGSMFVLPGHAESMPLDDETLELRPLDAIGGRTWPTSKPVPVLEAAVQESQSFTEREHPADLNTLASALAAIPNDGAAGLDYDAWRNIIFAIHHATDGDDRGLALAHEFSQRSAKYDEQFLNERVWQYIKLQRGGQVRTERTIYDAARKAGWVEPLLDDFENLDQDAAASPMTTPINQTTGDANEVTTESTPSDQPAADTAAVSFSAPGVEDFDDLDAPNTEQAAEQDPATTAHAATSAAPEAQSTLDPATKAAAPARFLAIPDHEFIRRPAPEWHVRGVIPRADLVFIIGEAGSGKSFLALELAAAVSRGVPWRGARVRKGKIAYIAAEGAGGFRNRVAAYLQHNALTTLGGWVVPAAPNFLQVPEVRELIVELRKCGHLDLVVVDTLAQVTAGGDENSFEDMGRALGHCRAIRRATGATVVLVHHLGKDATRGARGHSSMNAAADAVIEITREASTRYARVSKQKDGADGAVFPFRLNVVPLGLDADGEVIDSCVIEHLDEKGQHGASRTPSGATQRLALVAAHDIADTLDGLIPVGSLIDAVVARMPASDPQKRDKRREHAKRAIDALVADRYLFVEAGELGIA